MLATRHLALKSVGTNSTGLIPNSDAGNCSATKDILNISYNTIITAFKGYLSQMDDAYNPILFL
jgi:hypothetical protein